MNEAIPFHRLFEDFSVTPSNEAAFTALGTQQRHWSSAIGCLVQASDLQVGAELSAQAVVKPSLFVQMMLASSNGTRCSLTNLTCANGMLVAVALREPRRWVADMARGARLRGVGIAIPLEALEELGLAEEFNRLFDDSYAPVAVKTAPASPRLQGLAKDLLVPLATGAIGRLLLDAHVTEILARTLSLFARGNDNQVLNDHSRSQMHRVRDMLEANLARAWTLAEVANVAGVSIRSLNMKFRAAYGTSVFDYLKSRRLEVAHQALVQQNMPISEIAYSVGYDNPANFSTAFRRQFGIAPSRLRRSRGM
jgi:AraC-like DNA-binding protein